MGVAVAVRRARAIDLAAIATHAQARMHAWVLLLKAVLTQTYQLCKLSSNGTICLPRIATVQDITPELKARAKSFV